MLIERGQKKGGDGRGQTEVRQTQRHTKKNSYERKSHLKTRDHNKRPNDKGQTQTKKCRTKNSGNAGVHKKNNKKRKQGKAKLNQKW